jgi:hypothetical protein
MGSLRWPRRVLLLVDVDGNFLHLFKGRKMKALLGLVIFVLLPLALVF